LPSRLLTKFAYATFKSALHLLPLGFGVFQSPRHKERVLPVVQIGIGGIGRLDRAHVSP
jgi:hypothetical protein